MDEFEMSVFLESLSTEESFYDPYNRCGLH